MMPGMSDIGNSSVSTDQLGLNLVQTGPVQFANDGREPFFVLLASEMSAGVGFFDTGKPQEPGSRGERVSGGVRRQHLQSAAMTASSYNWQASATGKA